MLAAGGSEGYFMSDEEWKAQVKMGAEVCKGRVPSVAGVFELSATEAVKRAQYAADVGCDFVQIAPLTIWCQLMMRYTIISKLSMTMWI